MARAKQFYKPKLYCICRKPSNGTMIACDGPCKEWFHIRCVKLSKRDAAKIDSFICINCSDRENQQPNHNQPPPRNRNSSITPPPTPGNLPDCEHLDLFSAPGTPNDMAPQENSAAASVSSVLQQAIEEPLSPPPTPGNTSQISSSSEAIEIIENEPALPSSYFFVESIEEVRYPYGKRGEREFLVRWSGYTEGTWEREQNLDGCVGLLNSFLKTKNLRPTKVVPRAGASLNCINEPRNWMTSADVLNAVKRFQNVSTYNTTLTLEEFTLESFKAERDCLLILTHYSHFYIILKLEKPTKIFIADGNNMYMQDEEVQQEIHEILKTNVKPGVILYSQQTKVDHCGSSAALIALEIKRIYRNFKLGNIEQWPKQFRVAKDLRKRFIDRFHKFESQSFTAQRHDISQWKPPSCEKCGKTFRKKNAGIALARHVLNCKIEEERKYVQ